MTAPRLLHVANGTSTTATIEAAGIPGELSIWADVLYEGPVPGDLTDDELLTLRGGDSVVDVVNDMRLWRATIQRHQSYDELILWYEHDLFDQLNLIQLLPWIRERVPTSKVVSLICVGSFPGRPHFKGLGELTPAELGSLLDTRTPVTERQYALAQRAWGAFRKSTPEHLDQLRHEDLAALPYLGPALTRFLQEYPWTTDGLSRTERRLLELAAEGGGIRLVDAFPRMHEGEDAYYLTDLSLATTAQELSQTSPALIGLAPVDAPYAPLAWRVTLTPAGIAVLAGQQDRVAICGIDRWLGGVHLESGGVDWRWDPSRGGIVRHGLFE